MDKNITFLRHYKQLDRKFKDPDECYKFYVEESRSSITEKIREKHSLDISSILGTYYRINPSLISPEFYHKPICSETNRIIITQYRTGSHHLRIQTGRADDENRNARLCKKCNNDVQTV